MPKAPPLRHDSLAISFATSSSNQTRRKSVDDVLLRPLQLTRAQDSDEKSTMRSAGRAVFRTRTDLFTEVRFIRTDDASAGMIPPGDYPEQGIVQSAVKIDRWRAVPNQAETGPVLGQAL